MSLPHFVFKSTGGTLRSAEITMNGHKVEGVRSFDFKGKIGEVHRVIIEFCAMGVDLDVEGFEIEEQGKASPKIPN